MNNSHVVLMDTVACHDNIAKKFLRRQAIVMRIHFDERLHRTRHRKVTKPVASVDTVIREHFYP